MTTNTNTRARLRTLLTLIDHIWLLSPSKLTPPGVIRRDVGQLIDRALNDSTAALPSIQIQIKDLADTLPEGVAFADPDIGMASTLEKGNITLDALFQADARELPPEIFVDTSIRLAVALGLSPDDAKITPVPLLAARQMGKTPLDAAIALLADPDEVRDPAQQPGDESAIPLNPAQEIIACLEGWCLSMPFGDKTTPPWQLQKLDETEVFDADIDAWRFVTQRAACGSVLHHNALQFLAQHSCEEYRAILDHTGYAE